MFPAGRYAIRTATPYDAADLTRLAVLANQREAIELPALIGEIDGIPVAAIALEDGRITADPYASPPALSVHLRLRATGVTAARRRPSVAQRIRAAQGRETVAEAAAAAA